MVDHVTAMTTKDAYYWLKMARELDNGTLGKGKADPGKGYPDLVPFAIKDSPSLLAEFISLSKNFTGGDYYRAGLMLVAILAGLFVFPLFFYFNRLGFGASAVLGGLVGSFGHAYYDRTMMGRVDTDLLNTFFPLMAACFILPMDKEKTLRGNIGLAIGAGLTMYLFNRWYQMPVFILVYLFFMAVYLLLGRVHWQTDRGDPAGIPHSFRPGLCVADYGISADFPAGIYFSIPHGADCLAGYLANNRRGRNTQYCGKTQNAAWLFAVGFCRVWRADLSLFSSFQADDPDNTAAHSGPLVDGWA